MVIRQEGIIMGYKVCGIRVTFICGETEKAWLEDGN